MCNAVGRRRERFSSRKTIYFPDKQALTGLTRLVLSKWLKWFMSVAVLSHPAGLVLVISWPNWEDLSVDFAVSWLMQSIWFCNGRLIGLLLEVLAIICCFLFSLFDWAFSLSIFCVRVLASVLFLPLGDAVDFTGRQTETWYSQSMAKIQKINKIKIHSSGLLMACAAVVSAP